MTDRLPPEVRHRLEALLTLAVQLLEAAGAVIRPSPWTGHHVAEVGSLASDDPAGGLLGEAAMVASDGDVVGDLRVFGTEPKRVSAVQQTTLRTLADQAAAVLELQLAREQLRRAGHDLRNPLTTVSMSLQMLEEQPAVAADEDAAWMVRRALSGTRRLDELIERLLEP